MSSIQPLTKKPTVTTLLLGAVRTYRCRSTRQSRNWADWLVKYKLQTLCETFITTSREPPLALFFRSVITFKGAMAEDWWCCQCRWMYPPLVRHEAQSAVFRMQNREEEERDTDSQRPSTSHVLPFLSLILDYYTRLQWAERPGMLHVEKASSKDAMKSSFYFMILERNWGFRDIIENISLNKNDSVLLKDFFPLNKRSGHLSFDFVFARRRWHLVSNGE